MPDSSNKLQRAMASVRDEQALRDRLDSIVARKGLQDVRIGVLVDGRRIILTAGAASEPNDAGLDTANDIDACVMAGCLAKSLTGTLVSEAVRSGRVGWRDGVAHLLACSPRRKR
jgi:CubicO group peptidase (beta-lactamase class C family)